MADQPQPQHISRRFNMNKLIVALAIALGSLSTQALAVETKKVCIEVKDKEGNPVKDPKTGKVKESCKEVKIHKKLEGTEVPTKK